MAFNLDNLARWSISYNATAPSKWAYNGNKGTVADNLDVITADGYFNDAPSSFFRVGDVIYISALPIASVFASDQAVTVQSLNPTVVRGLNGLSPIFTVINNVIAAANAVGLVQNFGLPGLVGTDFPSISLALNPSGVRILSVMTITDGFIITFDINPGVGVAFQGLFFRESFS